MNYKMTMVNNYVVQYLGWQRYSWWSFNKFSKQYEEPIMISQAGGRVNNQVSKSLNHSQPASLLNVRQDILCEVSSEHQFFLKTYRFNPFPNFFLFYFNPLALFCIIIKNQQGGGMSYRFDYRNGVFILSKTEGDLIKLLCSFKKSDIRKSLENYADANGESSHWIGSIIKLFNQTFVFPSEVSEILISPADYPNSDLIKYLQNKGYRIYRKQFVEKITDKQIINHLLDKGYIVERDGIIEIKEVLLDGEKKWQ
jgi:hypothetical protein